MRAGPRLVCSRRVLRGWGGDDPRLPGGVLASARQWCSTRLERPAFRRRTPAVTLKEAGLVEVDGTVVEALPKGIFRVEVPGGNLVLAHVAGTERVRLVRILPGDRVRVSLSPNDPGRGRIIDQHR